MRIASGILGVAVVALLAACHNNRVAPTPTAPTRLLLTSRGSDYSPETTLAVTVRVGVDSVMIGIDSGSIVAPGRVAAGGPALMKGLTLSVLLVTTAAAAADTVKELPARWMPLASSGPRPVADSLHLGVPARLADLRFAIARPPGLDPATSWVVFRVDGDALVLPARLADGTLPPSLTIRGGVVGFVCAGRNLDGAPDANRTLRMSENYLAAC